MTAVIVFAMARSVPSDLREQLFQTAVTSFRERGYHEVTVSQITRETGVAKGTFFNYFPTKDHVLAESFHRKVQKAFDGVSSRSLPGTDAILAFVRDLSTGLARDRELTRALATRLSELPGLPVTGTGGELRDEERIRSWIEQRLGETLPRAVPLTDPDFGLIAFLITWTLRGSLEEWVREGSEKEALEMSVVERIRYILESSGLPADG